MKTAIVAGATGLIGSHLVQLLLQDESFLSVTIIVRKHTELQHAKLKEAIVDFDKPDTLAEAITSKDIVFCCLGTTMKNAGCKEAFYKVDFTYITRMAEMAKQKGVKQFIVISSSGASIKSIFFYSRVKGETENRLKEIGFDKLVILRPSLLLGYRKEHRSAEKLVQGLFTSLDSLFVGPLKRLKGVKAETVAKAMIKATNNIETGIIILESEKIQELGSKL